MAASLQDSPAEGTGRFKQKPTDADAPGVTGTYSSFMHNAVHEPGVEW